MTTKTAAQKFAMNIWSLTASQLLYRIVSLILAVYLARYLGPTDLGIYYTAVSVITIFSAFTDLGITNLIIKEVSQDHSLIESYLKNFFFLQFFIGILFGIVIISFGTVAGYSKITMQALLIGSGIPLLGGLANCFNALLTAQELLYPFAAIEIVCLFMYAVSNAVVIIFGYGVPAFIAVMIFTASVKLVMAFWWSAKLKLILRIGIDGKIIKHMLILGLPFLLFNGIHFMLQRIDVVYLSFFADQEKVGHYAAASRLIFASIMFANVVAAVLYPTFARLMRVNRDRAREIISIASTFLLLIAVVISLFCTFSAKQFILFLYGNKFIDSIIPFIILAWFIPFFSLGILYGNLLIVGGKVWVSVWISVTSFFVLTIIYLILIPHLGIIAPAYAVLAGEAVRVLLFFIYTRKYFELKFHLKGVIKVCSVISVSVICGMVLSQYSWIASVAGSIIILFVGTATVRIITRETVILLKQILFMKFRAIDSLN